MPNQLNQPIEQPNETANAQGRFSYVAGGLAVLAILLAFGLSVVSAPSGLAENQVAGVAKSWEKYFTDIALIGKSAVIIDLTSGETLFELNPDAQLPLASLTKVPLVLVVSEVLPPEFVITIPRDIPQIGSFETLTAGEPWPVREVIDFTLITSSNDGAEILAEAAGGAIRRAHTEAPAKEPALWRMNALAQELGLAQTYFLNVSGLDVSTTLAGAYGSARDMATLFAHAYKTNSALFSGTARGNVLLTSEYGTNRTVAYNTNAAEAAIPGLIMGKTGFTDLAGGNLAVVFDLGLAHPVVAVILGSTKEGRFTDMQKLVEATRTAAAAE